MKKTLACTLAITGLLGSLAAHANDPVWVDSKEYKVLLDPGQFANDPSSAAGNLLQALTARLGQLDFDKTVDGSFAAGGLDQVAYYDTPGDCVLKKNDYSARVRSGSDDDVEFKFRHPDEELSYYTDVTGNGKNASSKLETDVTPLSLAYSHSTKQDPAGSGAPASIDELVSQFAGAGVLSAFGSESLVPVNGLHITQQEYDGPSADLGKSTAKFTLSLWYLDGSSAPALAELSFRVKADDDHYFTTPVLQRSQVLMQAMSTLAGWDLSPATTKTAWVYSYASSDYPGGFCRGG